jgi:hypothetical protein
MAKVHLDRNLVFSSGRRSSVCGRQGFYAPVSDVVKTDVWITNDLKRVSCLKCLHYVDKHSVVELILISK